MITAIDTNILLDILIPNARFLQRSKNLLDTALSEGTLVISEAVYAELAVQFPSQSALDAFLEETTIELRSTVPAALHRASEAWKVYARRRRAGFQCACCGSVHTVVCSECGAPITSRQHILTDFLVGAHALLQADRLLTRDLGYYRAYFKDLVLLTSTESSGA